MKKKFIVFYLTADGKHYNHVIINAFSLSRAYAEAKHFCHVSGMNFMGIVEEQTFKDNSQIFNI